MIGIRKALKANIRPTGVTAGLYYDDADEGSTFPYLVYSFEPITVQDESSDTLLLNIDGWDHPATGDTTTLEELMQTIDGNGSLVDPSGLNEKIIKTDEVTLILRRENRYSIPDDNKSIKRRRYQYLCTVFERSES